MASILDRIAQKEKTNQQKNSSYNDNISQLLSKSKQASKSYPNQHAFDEEMNEESYDYIQKDHQKQSMQQSFSIKQIDIKRLQSKLMEGNEDHKQCINMIIAFNEELALAQEKGEILKNGIWKAHFYKTLQYLLSDLNSTYNRNIQSQLVKQVSDWAKEQLLKLNSENTQIRSFEGDRAFMLKTLMGFSRDFSKYQLLSRPRDHTSKSAEKMIKTVSFMSANSTNIFTSNNESNLEESTRDRMLIDQTFSAGGSKDQTMSVSDQFIYSRDQTVLTSTPFLTSNEFLESPRKGDYNKGTNEKISLLFTQEDESAVCQMPSCQIEDEQREYKLSARTKHCHYEPPSERLKLLKRRMLSCDQNPCNQLKQNQISQEEPRKQNQSNSFNNLSTQKVIEKQSKVDLNLTQNIKVSQQLNNRELSKQSSLDLESTQSDELEVRRNCKRFQRKCYQHDGVLASQRQLPELDKRKKSQSTYFAYQPSEDPREIRMENKWIESRQIQLREKRENEEMIEVMKQWATAKGRIDKEIQRKIDSSLYSSRYKECEHKLSKTGEIQNKSKDLKREQFMNSSLYECKNKRSQTQYEHPDSNTANKGLLKVVDMRNIIPSIADKQYEKQPKPVQKLNTGKHLNLSKMEMLKLFHGNLINLKPTKNVKFIQSTQPSDPDTKKEFSLSVYSQIQEAQKAKSFSSILQSAKHSLTLSSQLAEVNCVKDKLSKKKIRVSYKSLQNSLTFEEESNNSNVIKEIPAPGQGLFSNPFSAIGLKKRRKNKK